MDFIKVFGKSNCSLTVAGATVPGQGMSRRNGGKIGINFIRILWAMLRVLFGMFGKMIFEIKVLFSSDINIPIKDFIELTINVASLRDAISENAPLNLLIDNEHSVHWDWAKPIPALC